MVENSFKYSIFDRRSMILNFILRSFFESMCVALVQFISCCQFSFNFLHFFQFMSWFYVCSSSPLPLTLHFVFVAQEFYLPMQSGGILSPENLSAIFLNLQVIQISFTNLSISNPGPTDFLRFLAHLSQSELKTLRSLRVLDENLKSDWFM